MRLRGLLRGVKARRLELRVVSRERGDELRHALVAAQLAEGLRRLVEGEREPAEDHLAAVPARDVVRGLADAAVDELDRVRRRERPSEVRRGSAAEHPGRHPPWRTGKHN